VDTSSTDESRQSVYTHTETEKWLTLRTRRSIDYIGRIEAAHLSHPGSGRLLGDRVSVLANCVVLIDEPDIGSSHT
jgi:hypothetical protein